MENLLISRYKVDVESAMRCGSQPLRESEPLISANAVRLLKYIPAKWPTTSAFVSIRFYYPSTAGT